MSNPIDRWNPGWNFVMNLPQQRAQAGGNRALQPVLVPDQPLPPIRPAQQPVQQPNARPVFERRHVPAPIQNPNRRNNNNRHNPVRREHRHHVDRPSIGRDEQERIETVSRKKYQIRTALEFDPKESICWTSIEEKIEEISRSFSGDGDSENIFIPDDKEIASMLRSQMQSATIRDTQEILVNFGASENDLRGALRCLEMHLTTNACEYDEIENVANDLIKNVDKLTMEIDQLEEIMCRIDQIRLY